MRPLKGRNQRNRTPRAKPQPATAREKPMSMDDEARDTILSAMISARAVLLTCWYDNVSTLDDPARKRVIERRIEWLGQAIELIETNQKDEKDDNEQASR